MWEAWAITFGGPHADDYLAGIWATEARALAERIEGDARQPILLRCTEIIPRPPRRRGKKGRKK